MCNTIRRPSSRIEFECALTEFIAHGVTSRRRRQGPIEITRHTPLFESGLVDSLAILELIAFVEQATGRPIPARQVHMKNFGTIDRICGSFWPEERGVS
jgi:acyl carrier protein